MRDDTPVKYESIVPSLTGVREARRRGRVAAGRAVSLSVWGKGARFSSTAHDRTRLRERCEQHRGYTPVKHGVATPQLTGATWGHLG